MVRRDRDLALETFHLECVVLAGRAPQPLEEQRSFEIFRNSLKDVRVLTFDELLAKLRSLRDLLASGPDVVEQLAEVSPSSSPSLTRSPDKMEGGDLF